MMARLAWTLQYVISKGGLRAHVTLAMLTFIVGLHGLVLAPLQKELARLQATQVAEDLLLSPSERTAVDTQMVAQRFLAYLPAAVGHDAAWGEILAKARGNGIAITRQEWRREPLSSLSAHRQVMRISSTGSYAEQRRFMNSLLVAMPTLAVDRLALEKNDEGAEELTMSYELSLLYRDQQEVVP